jgi:RNA polymerase sigma factor (sigma-70 family)
MSDIEILEQLFTGIKSERAWEEFLKRYSNLILKVIWQFEKDRDTVMDAYVYVCSKLVQNNFAILKKYDFNRPDRPKFSTWLVVVIKNLCIDFFRVSERGKTHALLLRKFTKLEKLVFELYYLKGYPVEEIEKYVREKFGISRSVIGLIDAVNEKWAGGNIEFIRYREEISAKAENMVDENDLCSWVSEAVMDLPELERTIILLKFWEGMSASEIAEILQIYPVARVYKIIEKALQILRKRAEERSKRVRDGRK